VGQPSEDGGFVRCVPAVEIQSFIGFHITEPARVADNLLKGGPFALHPGKDVVTGPVKNTVNQGKLIRDQPFLQRLDDRNSSGYRGFEEDPSSTLFRRGKNFGTMVTQKGLVGGNHHFTRRQRRQGHLSGNRSAAHQFADDINLRIGGDGHGIIRQLIIGQLDVPRTVEVPDGCAV